MADTNITFDLNGFDQQKITCSNCGWTGIGSQVIIIDLYGIGDAKQVNCPKCDNNLGSVPRTDATKSGPLGE
jgi:predicted nucleic-acid-binding Zn-ribbon protein